MRDGEIKTRDDMREIRDEVTTIREMLPKVKKILLSSNIWTHTSLFSLKNQDDREK